MMSDERKRARADERAAVQAARIAVHVERLVDTMAPPGPALIADLERLLNPRPFPGGQMLPQHPEHPVTPAPPPRHDHWLARRLSARGYVEAGGRWALGRSAVLIVPPLITVVLEPGDGLPEPEGWRVVFNGGVPRPLVVFTIDVAEGARDRSGER